MLMQSTILHLRERCFLGFRAARGHQNALIRRTRRRSFSVTVFMELYSRSKHTFAGLLMECPAPVMVDRLIANISDQVGFDTESNDRKNDFDSSSTYKKFSFICLGSSSPIELYDGTCCWSETKGHLNVRWNDSENFCKEWRHTYPDLSLVNSSLFEPSSLCTSYGSSECSSKIMENFSLGDAAEKHSSNKVLVTKQNSESCCMLDKSICLIPGITKKQCRLLENCGFYTVRQLLSHFPRTYANIRNAHVETEVADGQYVICFGKITSSRAIRTKSSCAFLEVVVQCEIGGYRLIYVHLKKFFRGARFTTYPFLKILVKKYNEGDYACVSGKVRTMPAENHYEMREYDLDKLEADHDSSFFANRRPYPIYPSKKGIKPKFLKEIIGRALQVVPGIVDPIPESVIKGFGLLHLGDAYRGIHYPRDINEADLARKRLVFDEFFYFQLRRVFQWSQGLDVKLERDWFLNKYKTSNVNALPLEEWSCLTKSFLKAFPYCFTSSQLKAVSQIIWDLRQPVPVKRLLQGDVGCGKTAVVFLACMEVIGSGYQAALLVPTELLAIQHYELLLSLLDRMDDDIDKPSVALLTGSTSSKQAKLIREGLRSGNISFVIGTHSLISESVEFCFLRIAVVDEQHRFGVIQRGKLNSKLFPSCLNFERSATNLCGLHDVNDHRSITPHALTLSATPIPRTLALALHGDFSLTQMQDIPPGRFPVQTYVFEGNEAGLDAAYQMVFDDLESGGKVYFVYRAIEPSERMPWLCSAVADFSAVSLRFTPYLCGLMHGKMTNNEKNLIMRRFRSGEIRILLSTRVVEIGVDIPDASTMVVMNAERYGLAELHQLRGRVGRSARKSKCILLSTSCRSLEKLKILQNSSDGFHLACTDLLIRGPGDLLGKKQSGHLSKFSVARLESDGILLKDACSGALNILGTSNDLEQYPRLKVELSVRQPLSVMGD